MLKVASEAIWLKWMLVDMKIQQNNISLLYYDNQGILRLEKNTIFREHTKCIDIHCHFIPQLVEDGIFEMQYCPT